MLDHSLCILIFILIALGWEHMTNVFWWYPCCSFFFNSFLCCPIMSLYVPSSVLWCPLWFPHKKRCSVRLYHQLFVGGLMSYLRYLCLLAHSGIQYILCYVFDLFFFVLCDLCCQFLWIVYFRVPLLYSLTFIWRYQNNSNSVPMHSKHMVKDFLWFSRNIKNW